MKRRSKPLRGLPDGFVDLRDDWPHDRAGHLPSGGLVSLTKRDSSIPSTNHVHSEVYVRLSSGLTGSDDLVRVQTLPRSLRFATVWKILRYENGFKP